MADEAGWTQDTKAVSTEDALACSIPNSSPLHILQPLHQATLKLKLINDTPYHPRYSVMAGVHKNSYLNIFSPL
jgi:hypothetical protein